VVGIDPTPSDARLFRTFQLVNDWLKFGEAKNGVLVTLNGAAIVALHNMAKQYGPWDWLGTGLLWWATFCCGVSLFVGLASFYARTNVRLFSFAFASPAGTGAIYFGHIAEMSKEDLLQRLMAGYDQAAGNDTYLDDLAGQVIINAKLARKKLQLFNVGLLWTLAGLLTPVGMLLYYWRYCDAHV
jgi:hypothetical protein